MLRGWGDSALSALELSGATGGLVEYKVLVLSAPGSPTNPGGRLWVPGSRGATRCRQNWSRVTFIPREALPDSCPQTRPKRRVVELLTPVAGSRDGGHAQRLAGWLAG